MVVGAAVVVALAEAVVAVLAEAAVAVMAAAAVAVMDVVMATAAASTSVDRVAGGTTTAFASAGIIDTGLIGVSTHDR